MSDCSENSKDCNKQKQRQVALANAAGVTRG